MKLTIIETGTIPADVEGDYPPYPDMFARLLGAVDETLRFDSISPVTGEALPDPATLAAILITGSPASVYDDEVWQEELQDFIRFAASVKTPQIGICFGHQALAQALGGKVEKAPQGWGIGRHIYDVTHRPDWMGEEPPAQIALNVSHQDQVMAIPPGADIILASDFCPAAGLAFTDSPAISFQGHPEFSDAYAAALYKARKGKVFSDDDVAAALSSMRGAHDADLIAQWMARFLQLQA